MDGATTKGPLNDRLAQHRRSTAAKPCGHFRIVKRSTITGRVLKVISDSSTLRTEHDVRLFLEGFGRDTGSWKTTIAAEWVQA